MWSVCEWDANNETRTVRITKDEQSTRIAELSALRDRIRQEQFMRETMGNVLAMISTEYRETCVSCNVLT